MTVRDVSVHLEPLTYPAMLTKWHIYHQTREAAMVMQKNLARGDARNCGSWILGRPGVRSCRGGRDRKFCEKVCANGTDPAKRFAQRVIYAQTFYNFPRKLISLLQVERMSDLSRDRNVLGRADGWAEEKLRWNSSVERIAGIAGARQFSDDVDGLRAHGKARMIDSAQALGGVDVVIADQRDVVRHVQAASEEFSLDLESESVIMAEEGGGAPIAGEESVQDGGDIVRRWLQADFDEACGQTFSGSRGCYVFTSTTGAVVKHTLFEVFVDDAQAAMSAPKQFYSHVPRPLGSVGRDCADVCAVAHSVHEHLRQEIAVKQSLENRVWLVAPSQDNDAERVGDKRVQPL